MRILPHQQDTGGFFVAVLEKVHDWPVSPSDRDYHACKSISFDDNGRFSFSVNGRKFAANKGLRKFLKEHGQFFNVVGGGIEAEDVVS